MLRRVSISSPRDQARVISSTRRGAAKWNWWAPIIWGFTAFSSQRNICFLPPASVSQKLLQKRNLLKPLHHSFPSHENGTEVSTQQVIHSPPRKDITLSEDVLEDESWAQAKPSTPWTASENSHPWSWSLNNHLPLWKCQVSAYMMKQLLGRRHSPCLHEAHSQMGRKQIRKWKILIQYIECLMLLNKLLQTWHL